MANKAVLEIDVHDEKFQKFLQAFGDLEKHVTDMGSKFPELFGVPKGATVALDEIAHSGHKATRSVEKIGTHMGRLGDSAKKAGGHVKTLLSSVTDLSALLIPLSVGGFLFGLDALANRAMTRQKSARGLGMSTGAVSAFDTYMQKFLSDPKSFLGTVFSARNSLENRAPLAILHQSYGLPSYPALQKMGNEKASFDILLALRRAPKSISKTSKVPLTVMQQEGLTGLLPYNQINTLRTKALQAAQANILSHEKSMDIGKSASEWANLAIKLKAIGTEIETSLMKDLQSLTPYFGTLASAAKIAAADLAKFAADLIVVSKDVRKHLPKGPTGDVIEGGLLAATGYAITHPLKIVKKLFRFGGKGAAGDAVATESKFGPMGWIAAAATAAAAYAYENPKEMHKLLADSRAWAGREHEKLYKTPMPSSDLHAQIVSAVKEGIREGMRGAKVHVKESPLAMNAHAAHQ